MVCLLVLETSIEMVQENINKNFLRIMSLTNQLQNLNTSPDSRAALDVRSLAKFNDSKQIHLTFTFSIILGCRSSNSIKVNKHVLFLLKLEQCIMSLLNCSFFLSPEIQIKT
jgi:hypothetical protein